MLPNSESQWKGENLPHPHQSLAEKSGLRWGWVKLQITFGAKTVFLTDIPIVQKVHTCTALKRKTSPKILPPSAVARWTHPLLSQSVCRDTSCLVDGCWPVSSAPRTLHLLFPSASKERVSFLQSAGSRVSNESSDEMNPRDHSIQALKKKNKCFQFYKPWICLCSGLIVAEAVQLW